MRQIKNVKLDNGDFMNRATMANSDKKPNIISGAQVTLRQNGLEILATIGPKQTDDSSPITCKITQLLAGENKYKDIFVGDTIKFEACNIFSLH